MWKVPKFLFVFAFWVMLPNGASAWSSSASKTHYYVHRLKAVVEEYRTEHGKLPSLENFKTTLGSEYPTTYGGPNYTRDLWHREIIYRNPGVHGEYDIYSIGADGVDDDGRKDDISIWAGVNDGYYWMKWWPLGRRIVLFSCALALLIVISKIFRPSNLAVPIAGGVAGLGIALGTFCQIHPGEVSSHNIPLEIAFAVAAIVFLISSRKLITLIRYQS